jgi:hypothetical protein
MRLVDEIIELLSSKTPSIENALFKAQVLAHRLGEREFKEWVDHELKGYTEDAELPGYRHLSITVMGNISNGAYRYSDQPLPLMHLDDGLCKKLQEKKLFESIAVIEEWSKNENDLSVVIAPEIYPLLSKGLGNHYQVERAWGKTSAGAMLQVITEVRSRLLELALQLSDRLPQESSGLDMKQLSRDSEISHLFRDVVFGDNVTINIGSGNIQGISNSIVQNDFKSLAALLRQNHVTETDIAELHTAVEADEKVHDAARKEFGPRVKAWIGGMISKAGTAGWKVATSIAGGLLTQALAAYYGFSKNP